MERIYTCTFEMYSKSEFNLDCINYSISQIFSYIILILSFTLKLPQITSIIKQKSVEGLSISSIYLDFFNVYFQFMYTFKKNINAKVWGEYLCIGIQNLFIIFLYWYYENNKSEKNVKEKKEIEENNITNKKTFVFLRIFGILISLTVLFVGLLTDIYPGWIWISFALTNIPSVLLSRIFQILSLLKTRNPGSLSASSFTMRYLKNFMQAFYLLIQVGDYLLIFNQIYNGTLSFCVYVLIVYFSKKCAAEKKGKKD